MRLIDANSLIAKLERRKKYLLAYSELQKKRQLPVEEETARISEIDGFIGLIKESVTRERPTG